VRDARSDDHSAWRMKSRLLLPPDFPRGMKRKPPRAHAHSGLVADQFPQLGARRGWSTSRPRCSAATPPLPVGQL
jgi:hypothetical protein